MFRVKKQFHILFSFCDVKCKLGSLSYKATLNGLMCGRREIEVPFIFLKENIEKVIEILLRVKREIHQFLITPGQIV